MASYIQGYDEDRFTTTVNRNFLCLICFNVLRDPVLCPGNQHCFCRACITRHLERSQRCPTCADKLTVDTLIKPNRMVKDYLNELNVHCIYINRGCQEIVQLQHLDRHEARCGFIPLVCTNQGCGVTLNRRDLIRHDSEECEYRQMKCKSCGEMTKTLADIEQRMAITEMKMSNMETKMERNIAGIKTDMEEKFEAVNEEVKGLKSALIEGFNQMKDVLVKTEDIKEENTRKVKNTASGDKENILVAGGKGTASVEIFNWPQRTWSPLQSMPEMCHGATSYVYNKDVRIAGGYCSDSGYLDSTIRIDKDPYHDLLAHWSGCPVKLPETLAFHSSDLYNDQLIVSGGYNGNLKETSDCIHEVQLVHPYTVKTSAKIPEPRRGHSTEIFDDHLLIVGGSTTRRYQDNLNSVVLYDIKNNECKQLTPLPYAVSSMATVRWGDNIVVIGGIDKQGKKLDTVLIYNVMTEQSHMLPPMKCNRFGCTAVVIRNNIVVLGGRDKQLCDQKSVEAFNFDRYSWEELPEMCQARWLHTATVV